MSALTDTRTEVAAAARVVARAGLIQAFGHVSARLDGGGFVLTSTAPLLHAQPGDVLELEENGNVLEGEGCPLEAPLHAALYAGRPDIGAICRTHSPHAAAWACRGEPPPIVHGLGGLSGGVGVYESPRLVCEPAAAAAVVDALGEGDCVLLRGNGAVCTARDLPRAAVRAWFLEERAMLADLAQGAPELSADELRDRSQHYEAEIERAWRWLRARFGDVGEPTSTNRRGSSP